MDNNLDFADDNLSNEWKYLTNRLALFVRQGQLIMDCLMFGSCFCVLKLTVFFKQNLQKSYLVVGIFAFVFPEGAFVVYIYVYVYRWVMLVSGRESLKDDKS